MTAETVALFLAGVLQPFVQEFIVRSKVSGTAARWLTIAVSTVLALGAVWATGGLAGGQVPAFSLADPSPLLGFLVAKAAPVYALSQIVFGQFHGTVHRLSGT